MRPNNNRMSRTWNPKISPSKDPTKLDWKCSTFSNPSRGKVRLTPSRVLTKASVKWTSSIRDSLSSTRIFVPRLRALLLLWRSCLLYLVHWDKVILLRNRYLILNRAVFLTFSKQVRTTSWTSLQVWTHSMLTIMESRTAKTSPTSKRWSKINRRNQEPITCSRSCLSSYLRTPSMGRRSSLTLNLLSRWAKVENLNNLLTN